MLNHFWDKTFLFQREDTTEFANILFQGFVFMGVW